MSTLRRSVRDRIATMALPAVRRAAGVQDRLDPATGAVALTFDDGPDPRFTPLILDVLADARVLATFFVTGDQAASHSGLVRRIVNEGHALGTHSQSHAHPLSLGYRDLAEEYRGGRRAVEAVVGAPVPLFRPPNGYLDPVGAVAIRVNRLRPWLWTVDPRDWRPGVRPEEIAASVSALAAGDVVLLHDGLRQPPAPESEDRSATMEAVALIIERGRQMGLGFLPLPAEPSESPSPKYV